MKDGCRVKICGITSLNDARLAANAGADYIGMIIDVRFSPRSMGLNEAGQIFKHAPLPAVALVHQMEPDKLDQLLLKLRPHAVQFLSPEGPELAGRLKDRQPGLQIWQSLFMPAGGEVRDGYDFRTLVLKTRQCREAGIDAVLFDTAVLSSGRCGGTGLTGDWELAARLVREAALPVFLAGGIKPGNVRRAVEKVRPFGIDLSSGVEEYPGKKSPAGLKALMEALEQAENHKR
ncbi:MAG: phosphoribosylanthranilate isomerase [Peptococcaceae bacterium]|nr:phosphoribosylanthranilate isomerase [Peptococcaceae bacterium]